MNFLETHLIGGKYYLNWLRDSIENIASNKNIEKFTGNKFALKKMMIRLAGKDVA